MEHANGERSGGGAVTDLVTRAQGEDGGDVERDVRWAPASDADAGARRRTLRRWGLWAGIPAGLLLAGAAAASAFLIAPGTTVAGVPVGGMTAGAAQGAIDDRLQTTALIIDDTTVTGAELGATVDAQALAEAAFDAHPMWNVTAWFGEPLEAAPTIDPAAATTALAAALPARYVAATPASVTFEDGAYAVTPSVDGEGIDLGVVERALTDAFAAGSAETELAATVTPVPSLTTTERAQATADQLNAMLETIGFYVGDERTVPVDASTAASWLQVASDDEGEFTIEADEAAIQTAVAALPEQVDQDAADATVITNSAGDILSTAVGGQDGRVLGATTGIASAFAAQLADGEAAFALPVEVTEHETTSIARLLEVDISEQRLYLKENGAVIDSWLVSTGRYGADTVYGRYNIGWKTPIQDMTGTAADSGKKYIQEDVRWAMYFNGDQAFHGVYWHSNWGNRMSAGCVGMPEWRAEQIYGWAPEGTDVWIHD